MLLIDHQQLLNIADNPLAFAHLLLVENDGHVECQAAQRLVACHRGAPVGALQAAAAKGAAC